MKYIAYIILLFLILSCSGYKNKNYKVVNSFFESSNNYFIDDKDREQSIYLESIIKNDKIVDTVILGLKDWNSYRYKGYYCTWINHNDTIVLSQKDKEYIIRQSESNVNFEWAQKGINNKKVIVTTKDSLILQSSKITDYTKKSDYVLLNLSLPLYNLKKDICFLPVYRVICKGSRNYGFRQGYAIMKRNEKEWKIIGYVLSTAIND